ncbi:MAG: FAD-dependent oxidoreductase [Candidatus Desulfofervidus auxilii]|nr:FAD-dependent oxidoreductase [Candidatus Desulfofervidus auxilii]
MSLNSYMPPIGAVMIIGGGIAGIQASLDLAEAGFKVYLVEKSPSIGGKMAQLDKTFPTNDCSMCILSPKLSECGRHINIEIITLATVKAISGGPGHFNVVLHKEPRYIDETLCTNCGLCIQYCPTLVPDKYNESFSYTKCIHLPFTQAIPAVPVIEPDYCLFLKDQMCQICTLVCTYKAIDFKQKPEDKEIEVGAIILASGYEIFDARIRGEFGYGRYSNVITALEFERLISASGPYFGHLKRPSDRKIPKRIAWIQCVGSRDRALNRGYCSSVCCMYATKEAILAKEHIPELKATIFFIDIRAFGKGYEQYYERAKKQYGINYVKSHISTIKEDPRTKNLLITYLNEEGQRKEEEFDLVVLSVGLGTSSEIKRLAKVLGINLNHYCFCSTNPFTPVETNRPGIYVCGVVSAPKDIPETVMEASGAAAAAEALLAKARYSLTCKKEIVPEKDVSQEEPKVGVFVCHCGTNIAGVLNISKLVEFAKTLPYVVYSTDLLYACAIDAQAKIKAAITEHDLNRIVICACTPRSHLPLFQEVAQEAGLNPYLVEMANIREHNSWVHSRAGELAMEKAKAAIYMAVVKAIRLKPYKAQEYSVNKSALVVGGGISGMTVALELAAQGFNVYLVEKTNQLGGVAITKYKTIEGENVQNFLKNLIEKIKNEEKIKIYLNSEVIKSEGFIGNFLTQVKDHVTGEIKEIKHGVTIIATGAQEFKPYGFYCYGKHKCILTARELEEEIAKNKEQFKKVKEVVMIQCVGSRDEERPYCSRVCCTLAIQNALNLKAINPNIEIYILYRDIRTYGFKEDYYAKARQFNVKFIRFEKERPPLVSVENNQIKVQVYEPALKEEIELNPDFLILSAAITPNPDNEKLSQIFKISLTQDKFFLEAHMKLRPVDFATDGIFLCGLAHGPKFISESIAQAKAAASRAATILTKPVLKGEALIAEVYDEKCDGCAYCVEVCPAKAIKLLEYIHKNEVKKVVEVNASLCKGCGNCMATCPKQGIMVRNFTLDIFSAMIEAALTPPT